MKYLKVAKDWRVWHLLKDSSIIFSWVHMQKLGKWRVYFTCGRIKHFPKKWVHICTKKRIYPNCVWRWFSLGVWMMLTSSVQFSRSVVSDSLRLHGLQHARFLSPPPTPGAYPNSCPSGPWCHPTISSSVVPFSSCLQSFPASGSFQMSQFFASGGQSTGVSASASVLPMSIQDWCLQRECFGF